MKPVILAEKPSQGKAYADAFSVKRHEGCDIDREGSNIFYSIFNQTGARNKTIKRLWINSLEIDEIRKGFMNLRDNEKDLLLYEEAKSRQISDWLVGMNGSRLYTLLLKAKGYEQVFPIGRVQLYPLLFRA